VMRSFIMIMAGVGIGFLIRFTLQVVGVLP
jgi:hypothetical protein